MIGIYDWLYAGLENHDIFENIKVSHISCIICLVNCRGFYDDIYYNSVDYVITSSRQLLQILYCLFIDNGDIVLDL